MADRKSLLILLLTTGISMVALFAFIPLISPLIRELGLAEWQGGLIVSIAGGFWMVFAPKWGRLSDKKGRKYVIVIGILGFFVSYMAMALFLDVALQGFFETTATLLIVFILMRSVMGVFFGAIPTSSVANIADISDSENRTKYMAMIGATQGLGIILGPMFAGLFATISLTAPLYAAAFLPLICLIIVVPFLKNSKPKIEDKQPRLKFTDSRIRLPLIITLLANSGSLTANMCVGYFMMDKFALDTHELSIAISYTLSLAGFLTISTQVLVMKFKKVKPLTWIKMGSLVAFVSFTAINFTSSMNQFVIAYCLAAAALTAIMPAILSYASQAVTPAEQGSVSGNMSSVQGFTTLVIPVLSTSIYGLNMNLPYILTGILFGGLFIFMLNKRHLNA